MDITRGQVDGITKEIIGAAIEVHRQLGPGLLESAYQNCLCHELMLRRIPHEKELKLPVLYKGVKIKAGYRIDVLVREIVAVEIKAIEKILPVHHAQMLIYLRVGNFPAGLLLNFNVSKLTKGINRFVNNLKE